MAEETTTECTHIIMTRKLSHVVIDLKGVFYSLQLATEKIPYHIERGPATKEFLRNMWDKLEEFQEFIRTNNIECDVVINEHNIDAYRRLAEVQGNNNGDHS